MIRLAEVFALDGRRRARLDAADLAWVEAMEKGLDRDILARPFVARAIVMARDQIVAGKLVENG